MKTVVMEITLNLMMNEGKNKEARDLISTGEHKIIVDGNIRYLVFKEN